MKNCSACPYSTHGSRDALSDVCDGCSHDPDTGWGGYTNHSVSDEFDHHPHYYSEDEEEYKSVFDLFDFDDDDNF